MEWVRREHGLVVSYTNDTLGLATADTLPQMRSLAYRLPLLGGIRVPLGYNDLEVQASVGVGVEWKTSETVVSQLVQTPGTDHIVQAYQGERGTSLSLSWRSRTSASRQRRAARVVRGVVLVKSPGQDAWAENTWTSGSVSGLARTG